MAFETWDSSTEIIVISLFKSISSNSERIAKDDRSILIASSFKDIEIIDTVSIIQKTAYNLRLTGWPMLYGPYIIWTIHI